MSEPTVDVNPVWEVDGYKVQDRTGYTTEHVDNGPGSSPYVIVVRETDGVGIGAYGSDAEVDQAIQRDKDWLASQPRTETPGATVATEVQDAAVTPQVEEQAVAAPARTRAQTITVEGR